MTYLHDGQKIQAIKVFREATGLGLKESKEAVEALERTGQFFSPTGSYQSPATTTSTAKLIRTVGCWIVALVLVITIVLVAAPFVFTGWLMNSSDELIEQVVEPGSTPMQPPTIVPSPTPGFADLLLKFGGEGINPGQFTDARRVAVDDQGYIYVGEWDGGRIQRFDPTGNFVSMWEVERRRAVTSLAADRAGVVYVVQGASLLRFNGETGEALDEMPRHESGGYDIVTIAPDGTILAATSDELIRFDANFNPIEGFAAGRLRELDLDTTFPPAADSLAIDGLGNIYALDGTNELVMKFAPDGRLLDHFALNENGSHDAIAVDGQGHLYIGYSRHIDIYDLEGRYIDKIEFDGLAFGLAVNGEDELWVASRTEILKFARHRR
jgi:sugar lactone lactonase YvrE